ncbi:MAG: transcription termination factor Rho [Verrucomicrobiia bacterium Tous-C2TDCM]|nr:MAG: transcription termination factor Rho [Verrucomicrobiae bacterium Tous-C2TDCM]
MTDSQTPETSDAPVTFSEEEDKAIVVPEKVDINEFQRKSLADLHDIAQTIGLRVAGVRSKHHLIFEILKFYGNRGTLMEAEGFLEYSGESFGFLRWPDFSFAANLDDVYIAASFVKRHELRPGQRVRGVVRAPREREKFLSIDEVVEIEGRPVAEWVTPTPFDDLKAMFPAERLILETPGSPMVSPRVIDLVAPLGKGQRGLIVAPPRGGKTILLKNMAVSIHQNNPEVELIVLLLDERPEEVTDFRETVSASIYSSTFDESSDRHIEVADMVLNRAKRLVEIGRDVVVLLDSLTRLARAHNSARQSGNGGGQGGGGQGKFQRNHGGGGGPIGSGGISPKALERSRRFFGAARNVDGGGSLTILATCLIETDSRMDDVIFEEFKGTGNMEITLDREMAESRIFPAIHLLKSGTRKDELLYHPEEYARIHSLRKQLAQRPAPEAMVVLQKTIRSTRSNAELLLRGIQ